MGFVAYGQDHLSRLSRFALLICIVASLGGVLSSCAINPAPVSSRPQPPSERVSHHIVASGDTLFGIAWRYEKELTALARANGLTSPYRINIGQKLTLDTDKPSIRRYAVPGASAQKTPVVKSQSTSTKSAPRKTTTAPAKSTTVKKASVKLSSNEARPGTSSQKLPVGEVVWRWPVKGAMSRQYDAAMAFKGINIQSSPGETVRAAAAGIVVYAGKGLRGYGNLLIIKHSDIYLSAYAHNRSLSVSEGDSVKAGAAISVVGGDPNNQGRLYFEVRKRGKTVDPTRLLPRQ